MKKTLISFLVLVYSGILYAQENDIQKLTAPIVAEGKRLYRSEMASWYGTDIFIEKYKNKENIGGYFSYSDGDLTKCIFHSRNEPIKVLGTISFDSTYNVQTANVDLTERDMTDFEKQLHAIRRKALDEINSNKDTIFKFYKNTNPNLIPMISEGEKKVYVLTGPKENGVVIFGNDYLMSFDQNSNLTGVKRLHKNIITINYGEKLEKDGAKVIGAMHSHLPETGDFLTATDICTLMLYSKFAGWEQHTVVSENYITTWHSGAESLIAVPRNAPENDKKKKRKKKDR